MKYGLKQENIDAIAGVFKKYPQIDSAVLYGSRAKGNYRLNSDIDLTIKGEKLDVTLLLKIENALDDLLLPYKMDVSIFHQLKNQNLIDHINRVGIEFYKKKMDDGEWKETTLSEITTFIGDGLHGTPQYDDSGDYFFINGNNLINGKIQIKSDTKRVNKEEAEKYIKPLSKNAILLSINGTIGNLAIYNDEKCMLGKSACYINLKDDVDKQFIYYHLFNKDFQSYINEVATGTTIPNVPLKGIREYSFELPPPPEQRAIAGVLGSLDDKIDLLQRQNNMLEKMAETLFRQWFENKNHNGTIGKLISIQNGYAFKSKNFKDNGEDSVVKIKNISGGIIDIYNCDFVDSAVAELIQDSFKIISGDILIAMTGAEIGKLGIIPNTDKKLWLNQRVGLLKEKYLGAKYLAYLQLKSDFGQDYINNTATGSAQPNISGQGIENCGFPILNEMQIKEYSLQLSELYQKVNFNLGQIQTLTLLRDTLLPKLMSGEVRVKGWTELKKFKD